MESDSEDSEFTGVGQWLHNSTNLRASNKELWNISNGTTSSSETSILVKESNNISEKSEANSKDV